MRISHVNIYPVRLWFVGDFSHSLKKGNFADNLVVEVVDGERGIRGYGEGAPRAYVTGETIDDAVAGVRRFVEKPDFPWDLPDAEHLWPFVDRLLEESGRHAAVCALETALIDALGKARERPALSFFPRDHYTDTIHYGAAVPLADPPRVREICHFIKTRLKIDRIKLKLNRNREQNRRILETARRVFGEGMDLKVDVNCDWDLDLAMAHLDLIREHRVRVVEQPMAPGNPDIAVFSAALKEIGVVLMADESACSLAQVRRLQREGHYGMINVRLSKCGGIRNSLRIVDALRRRRTPFQIACQLGESGILSAAGRTAGLLCRDAVYHDGSYDAFLLRENLTSEDVSFLPGGAAGPLEGFGLGVGVSRERLRRLCTAQAPLSLPRP